MTTQLTWSEATARHRAPLSCFLCTEPGKSARGAVKGWSKEHPRFWELDVQNMVRSYRPPHRHSKVLLVGEDADGIGAVSAYQELDGPAHIELSLMAVALRLKGQRIGDEMAEFTLQTAVQRAVAKKVRQILAFGYVWHENERSKKMCRRLGMQHTGQGAPGVEQWSLRLAIEVAEAD